MTESKAAYGTLVVTEDAADLAREAADRMLAWALEISGPVRIALSGGSTPCRTYQELVNARMIDRFPWPKVHWYWGDERFVPPDHPESNFRMTREAMLAAAPIPPANIHPVPTVGVDAEEAAPPRSTRPHAPGRAARSPLEVRYLRLV